MLKIPIKFIDVAIDSKGLEPIDFCFPLKEGQLTCVQNLSIKDQFEQTIEAYFEVMSTWPGGSIKWAKAYCQLNSHHKKHTSFTNKQLLATVCISNNTKNNQDRTQPFHLSETKNEIIIVNCQNQFKLNKQFLGVFQPSQTNIYSTENSSIILTDSDDIHYIPQIDQTASIKTSPLQIELNFKGYWIKSELLNKSHSTLEHMNFYGHFIFYKNSPKVDFKFTIHNSNSMRHHGGKWDLGNQNSFYFKQLALKFRQNGAPEVSLNLNSLDSSFSLTDLFNQQQQKVSLFQASSGGNNWQSHNHVNADNQQPLHFKGYQLRTDQAIINQGLRAQPSITIDHNEQKLTIVPEQFWQRFPKSISYDGTNLCLGLFPKEHEDGFELQPGEKSSYKIQFYAGEQQGPTTTEKIRVQVCPKYIADTRVLSTFKPPEVEDYLQKIITQGLTAKHSFFAKRETADEYGWRNFGDIYADHESSEYQGDDELVSHYNNQYDPLFGFLQQYLVTGESSWIELAEDLFQHIIDIDIYDTNLDRGEYNQGLFWHTDHYVPAKTASHRTYSTLQPTDVYMDHIGAGGPGSNHCYTSGLTLYYFLTGDQQAKQAVLKLTDWITNIFEGSGTFGELILALKNRNRPDIKNIISQCYPFDRGTGNYINALVDSFELTNSQSYLDKASMVLKKTFSSNDDIEQRNLSDIEAGWFYIIFLQSAYKYLLVKEKNNQLDRSFYRVKSAFMHYVQWILNNERPYLDTADILEYPNITWVAQDIRKACVLYMAAYFSENEQQQLSFQNKADYFHHYVTSTLDNDIQSQQTRVLSILMQNSLVPSFAKHNQSSSNKGLIKPQLDSEKSKPNTTGKLDFCKLALNTIISTNIKQEINWLRKISTKADQTFTKIGIKK